MILRERLIKEIEQMPPVELIELTKRDGYLETRKALAACRGNLSDDIILEREDRI
jgi:hypothetical protein